MQNTPHNVRNPVLCYRSPPLAVSYYQDGNIMTDLHEIGDLVALERERVSVMAVIHSVARIISNKVGGRGGCAVRVDL